MYIKLSHMYIVIIVTKPRIQMMMIAYNILQIYQTYINNYRIYILQIIAQILQFIAYILHLLHTSNEYRTCDNYRIYQFIDEKHRIHCTLSNIATFDTPYYCACRPLCINYSRVI